MPFFQSLPCMSSGHEVILKYSYNTLTHPQFSPLLMGGGLWGILSAFLRQKMLFCTNFTPVDLYVWSCIDIMMLGPHSIPPSCSSLPQLHFIINHDQSSSPPYPSVAHAPQPFSYPPPCQQWHCDLHSAGCNDISRGHTWSNQENFIYSTNIIQLSIIILI